LKRENVKHFYNMTNIEMVSVDINVNYFWLFFNKQA